MTYHTFELSYKMNLADKISYENAMYKSHGKVYVKNETVPTLVCKTLCDNGIRIEIKEFHKGEYNYYMLYYIINPRCVMEEFNYIGLFSEKDTDKMLDRVNEYIRSVYKYMPKVEECKLNRIDFCTNIKMSGQDEIYKYINLLQRGYYPKKYMPEMYYDMKSKRTKFTKNSCNIKKGNIVKITYYNKFDQLQENKKCRNIKDAKNILRSEIQCGKKKVRQLSDKFGYTSVREFLKHSFEIGEYVFKMYANKFCGQGDFYKIDELRSIIDRSNLKYKSKEMMHELVNMSANHSSVDTALRKLRWNYKVTRKIMKKFDDLGISPIVIPIRSKYDYFQNPLTLALNSCKNND